MLIFDYFYQCDEIEIFNYTCQTLKKLSSFEYLYFKHEITDTLFTTIILSKISTRLLSIEETYIY